MKGSARQLGGLAFAFLAVRKRQTSILRGADVKFVIPFSKTRCFNNDFFIPPKIQPAKATKISAQSAHPKHPNFETASSSNGRSNGRPWRSPRTAPPRRRRGLRGRRSGSGRSGEGRLKSLGGGGWWALEKRKGKDFNVKD